MKIRLFFLLDFGVAWSIVSLFVYASVDNDLGFYQGAVSAIQAFGIIASPGWDPPGTLLFVIPFACFLFGLFLIGLGAFRIGKDRGCKKALNDAKIDKILQDSVRLPPFPQSPTGQEKGSELS